ncbi:MAG: hypothetical protein RL660_973 [Bacteroidota bacterium]|jgi:carbamoyltransferase
MNILGFNSYGHDSAACIVQDGIVKFAVEEERLNRKKHAGGFPQLSIAAALEHASITLNEVQHVAFFWKPSISYWHIPIYMLKFWHKVPQLLKEQRHFQVEENLGMLNYLGDMRKLPAFLKEKYNAPNAQFKFHYIEHHLCHAASAYYPSGFNDAAILTIDGAGEWSTTLLATAEGNTITKHATVDTPYSLGAFYQAIARHLGFKLIEGPGKLMGLASYGDADTPLSQELMNLVQLLPNGKYKFDMSYFSYHYTRKSGVSNRFTAAFGPSKTEGKDWTAHELNLAAAAQYVVEQIVMHMVKHLRSISKSDNLCMAGGVALNSVANGIIAKSGLFKNLFIQPAAGDSGTAIGAALYVYHAMLNMPRTFIQKHSFLGPAYTQQACIAALEEERLNYVQLSKEALDEKVAKALAANYIVAWHHGAMEFGPRALGNRSILANAMHPQMKDILNARVKFREGFRPFAAIVTQEDCGQYFDHDAHNPYMLLVYGVKKEWQKVMPALTHVDGSVRIQTVNAEENEPLYKLLKAFQAVAGHPVLINTSFNIKGEPIVCTPQDAIRSFMEADIDILVLENLLVVKEGVQL